MKTTLDTLDEIRRELERIAQKEATNLFRLARKAKEHGVKTETVEEIREEGMRLAREYTTYPDRLLEWHFEYETKYAFR